MKNIAIELEDSLNEKYNDKIFNDKTVLEVEYEILNFLYTKLYSLGYSKDQIEQSLFLKVVRINDGQYIDCTILPTKNAVKGIAEFLEDFS